MTSSDKSSALARIASDLGSQVAHTPGRGENPAGGGAPAGSEAMADLFRVLDDEVAGFEGSSIPPPVKRGAGRPAGSLNRSTRQLQAYLQARGYRDPLEFLASIYSSDPRELAASLLAKPLELLKADEVLEVVKLQRTAAGEALPYLHQRTPQQVEMQVSEARPLIIIQDGRTSEAGGAGDAMSVYDLEQDQWVSGSVGPKSHDDRSHDDA